MPPGCWTFCFSDPKLAGTPVAPIAKAFQSSKSPPRSLRVCGTCEVGQPSGTAGVERESNSDSKRDRKGLLPLTELFSRSYRTSQILRMHPQSRCIERSCRTLRAAHGTKAGRGRPSNPTLHNANCHILSMLACFACSLARFAC